MFRVLVLNLGSTSTKAAIYEDHQQVHQVTLRHTAIDLAPYAKVMDQLDYRKNTLETWLNEMNVSLESMDLFCVRGGLVKPIPGGIYQVTSAMIKDLEAETYGAHVSNTGMAIGYAWGQSTGKEVIFLNAVVTDEMSDIAHISGLKDVPRRSVFHALNQKQIALEYAHSLGKTPQDLNLIVCHLGGGISVGAHERGRIVDVNNALEGDGPFSPERVGTLTSRALFDVLKANHGDYESSQKQLIGNGGMVSHFGTNDMKLLVERAQSEAPVKLVVDAMIYQVAKEIGSKAVVFKGNVDQILITGGLAYNAYLVQSLKDHVSWIAGVSVYPGEDELEALAAGALRYLRKEESLQVY